MSTEFDEQLKSRLLAFQKAHGLADDGAAGAKTWTKLVEGAGAEAAESQAAQQTEESAYGSSQAEPDDGTGSSVHGGIPFHIEPDSFDFHPDPNADNWQTTSCVSIVFGYGTTFLPMTRIEVGVIVGAPLALRDDRKISVREAQLDSANAASAAAMIIKRMLDSHAIERSEIQPRFVGFMGGAIMSTGLGYRVKGCYPKGR